ncbi:gliding motility-associated C-terminal domain-containing protein, partial [Belliella sp. DSM 107340]
TATVSFTETRADGACSNSYILTRTWTAVDECGNETTHVQTITVEDVTAPVFNETLPTDITVSCESVPAAVVLTASDNCGEVKVEFREEVKGEGCGNEIIRTWVAIDLCGNSVEHIQTITILSPAIIANDDDFGVLQFDYSGIVGNVFINDSLNGNSIDPSLVEVKIVDFGGLNDITIDSNGILMLVSAGTNTPGNYIVEYSVCEVANTSNCDTALVYLSIDTPKVDISVEKTSNNVVIWEGDEFDYQITVKNIGGTIATDVVLEDVLPVGVSLISQEIEFANFEVDYSFDVQGSRILWSISKLPVEAEVVFKVRVKALPLYGEESLIITNLVTVSSKEEDIDLANNTDTDVNTISSFFIPNVITPNGDGSNDSFVIKGLGKYVSHSLVLFNRYGDNVFESENYQNNWSAEGLPPGTYYYILKGTDDNGREHIFKGWIQVIKEF